MNEEGALRVVHDEIVAPGAPWSARVRRDQVLRIVDLEGEQGVDFLCYDALTRANATTRRTRSRKAALFA